MIWVYVIGAAVLVFVFMLGVLSLLLSIAKSSHCLKTDVEIIQEDLMHVKIDIGKCTKLKGLK